MGKLGDLFIKIGAKTQDLDKGLNQAGGAVKKFARQMTLMSINAAAQLAQIAAKGLKMGLDLARSTQIFGDAWDKAMSKAGAAFNTFVQSVMNWDWQGLGERMKSAMTGAGNVSEMRDLEFEVMNSIRIKEAALEEELELDRTAMRNVQLSYEERKKAAEHYLQTIKPIYDQQKAYYYDLAQSEMDAFIRGSGVTAVASTRKELETFLTEIANNPATLKALYNASTGNIVAGDDAMLAGLNVNAQTLDSYKKFAEHYQRQLAGDNNTKKLTGAIVQMYTANAAFNKENQRVITTLNTLGAQIAKETSNDDAAAEAAKRLADARALLNDELERGVAIQGKAVQQSESGLVGDLSGVGTLSEEEIAKRIEFFEKMQAASEELAYSLQDGLISALDELANAIAGVDGSSFGSVMVSLLTPLADAAIKAGMIILTTGEAVEAFKASLNSLDGPVAIAAGVALIAAGTLAKAGLAAISKSGSSAGTATASSSAGTASGATNTKYEDVNINVHIEGKLKGSDIVLAARNTSAAWAR